MKRTLGFFTLFGALVCTGFFAARAQPPPDKKAEKADAKEASPPKEDAKNDKENDLTKEKDPTQPSDRLKDLMAKKSEAEEQAITATLLAKVVSRNRPPLAILKIGDREFTVTKNSIIELPKVALKITEINLEGVQMELQSLKAGNRTIILK